APEEAALGVSLAEARGDQGHERGAGARALLVDVARKGLAPGSGLPHEQHGGSVGRHLLQFCPQLLHEAALADRHHVRRAEEPPDWRWRRPASRARSTVRSSFASDSGFSTKSKAPSLVASTAVSTVLWPDIITTGQPSVAAVDHSRSSVIPSTSGIQISSSTRSGICRAREARACAALAATSTS